MAWAEKIKSGYRGRYLDAMGIKQTAGDAPTRKEAIRLGQAEEHKVADGSWLDPKKGQVLFRDYFEGVWFPNCKLELNTRRSYWSTYTKHLEPTFGDRPMRGILSTHVQNWVSRMVEADYAPSTIHKVHIHLQTILGGKRGSSAIRDGYIGRNPCEGTQLPSIPDRQVQIYEPEEVDQLLVAIDPWWRLLPLFWSDTGLRWGEIAGVLVGDFTLGFRTFDVCRTIVEISPDWTDNDTAFQEKGYPKTKHARALPVQPDMQQLLAEHVALRGLGPEDRLFAAPARKAEHRTGRVLSSEPLRTETWPGGVPVSRGHFRKQVWRRAHEATGIRQLRPYDLRATNISWLLDGGMDPAAVMEWAGHVQMTTTMKYTKARRVNTKGLDALAKVRGGARRLSMTADG